MGCFKRTASKHVQYLGWNRSPAQVGCMRQALGPGALGKPRGSGWRGRWEGGSGWGAHVNPWLFHSNVGQNSLQKKKKVYMPRMKSGKMESFFCTWCINPGGANLLCIFYYLLQKANTLNVLPPISFPPFLLFSLPSYCPSFPSLFPCLFISSFLIFWLQTMAIWDGPRI